MPETRLITLDPGHFHAALIQKQMYPDVSRRASVFAPLGPDLIAHLNRVASFNARAENPTSWELDVHCRPDFLAAMLDSPPGNVVVLSGKNHGKIDYIKAAVEAGLNVLADKPWIIESANLPKLEEALETAGRNGVFAYDIMTERYEITSILQRELVNDAEVFGEIIAGSAGEPGVYMESVHHILKLVAGAPNLRPPWYFDIAEQGEGLSDVGTHLIDLAQGTLFPDQPIDHRAGVKAVAAKRWPTVMTLAEFQRVTGEDRFPELLAGHITGDSLDYYCNTQVSYSVRDVHVKLDVLWNYAAPEGAGDTHLAVYRGSRSRVEVRQGPEQNYRPELYVAPRAPGVARALENRIAALQSAWPGVASEQAGEQIRISIPDQYRVGHEAHFGQVTNQFFAYLSGQASMPSWEKPNMLAKYHVTTKGVDLSRE